MDTLIKNALIVTMDPENRILPNAYVGITGGKIAYIGAEAPADLPDNMTDASGCAVLPGLINAHTHLPMTLLRGYADDYDLQTWLNDYIFPKEARFDAESIYFAALLGLAEAVASGTTSVSDMYDFCGEIAQAAADAGVKANISRGILAFEPDFDFKTSKAGQESRQLYETWHGYDSGRIKIDMSIHAEYTSYPAVWRQVAGYAAEKGLGLHLHLSETKKEHDECVRRYGLTPAQVLKREGVFEVPVNCAHCVYITEEDMEILRLHNASAVHNPVSNLKLASGVADVPGMLKRGVNVALGTDGTASNNSMDLFEEIKLSAILHKENTKDPKAINAHAALTLATANGARAQGRGKECGMLVPGMDADLILVDFTRPHMFPCHNAVSNLVYSARGSDVTLTMVRGKTLYKDGEFLTIDLERVRSALKSHALPLLFGGDVPQLF